MRRSLAIVVLGLAPTGGNAALAQTMEEVPSSDVGSAEPATELPLLPPPMIESSSGGRGFFAALELHFATRAVENRGYGSALGAHLRVGTSPRPFLSLFGGAGFLQTVGERSNTFTAGGGLRFHSAGAIRFLSALEMVAGVGRVDRGVAYPFVGFSLDAGMGLRAASWIDIEFLLGTDVHFQIATGAVAFDRLGSFSGTIGATYYLDQRPTTNPERRRVRREMDEARFSPTDMPLKLRRLRNVTIGFAAWAMLTSTAIPLLVSNVDAQGFDGGSFALYVTALTVAPALGMSAWYMGVASAGARRARLLSSRLDPAVIHRRSRWWFITGGIMLLSSAVFQSSITYSDLNLIGIGTALQVASLIALPFGHGMRMMERHLNRGWRPSAAADGAILD